MMKKITEHPHRFGAFLFLLFVFSVIPLTGVIVFRAISVGGTQSRAAAVSDVPLIDKQSAVVIGTRKVCSIMGAGQTSVRIAGLDGGASARVGSTSFFTFGDTNMNLSGQLPNTVSSTTDSEAGDCITSTSKSSGGVAVPVLPKVAGECTVWPTDIVNAPDNKANFFFSSLNSSCQVDHIGLAELNTATLDATRTIPVFFARQSAEIPNYQIFGASLTRSGTDVYVFFGGQDSSGKDVVLLAKVAASSIADKSLYTYWDGSAFQSSPSRMVPLWDQGSVGTNGMSIRFNQYLGKWTAVYNTGYVSVLSLRTADNITGPWSGETVLINCLQYYALGDVPSAYPCYGAKDHPEYQKNNGQVTYITQSNTGFYQPFLHEITFGRGIDQSLDSVGNALYRKEGDLASGFTSTGKAFYASDFPVAGFSAVHEWANGSEKVYSINSPGVAFTDGGIAFYAPSDKQYLMAPIYQWDKGQIHRYSALDLSGYGYSKSSANPSFYARITNYRVTDDKVFDRQASNFQIGVQKNNVWVQGGHVKQATFSGLTPGSKFSVMTNTPLKVNRYMGQSLTTNGAGQIDTTGDIDYVSFVNMALLNDGQQMNTTNNLYGYDVRKNGQIPVEISNQLNPYRRANNLKSFVFTANQQASYDGKSCDTDCLVSSPLWQGVVPSCPEDITLTPTGPTACSRLSKITLSGFATNTDYDLYYCNPTCEDAVVRVIYQKKSDASGQVSLVTAPVSNLPTDSYLAQYFDNPDFTNKVLEKVVPAAKVVLGQPNTVPVPELAADGAFSVKFEGLMSFSGNKVRFNTNPSSGSVKVYLDDALINNGTTVQNAVATPVSGYHKVRYEYAHTDPTKIHSLTSNIVETLNCYDLTGDGVINSADQGVLAGHFGVYGSTPWDLNGDGAVNSTDLGLMATRYNQRCPFASPTPSPTPAPTPTPAPVAQACSISPTSVVKGSAFNLSVFGFGATGQAVSIIGAFGSPIYAVGNISGLAGTFTVPASAQAGLYRVRIDMGSGNFLYCNENLSVN